MHIRKKGGYLSVRSNSLFFGIIGTFAVALAATNVESLQTNASITNQEDYGIVTESVSIPKKNDLLGTYTVKSDKNTKLTLKNDGTYSLTINVCKKYLLLTGTYELRDTKLKLKNKSTYHDDLKGNEELSFTIVDENQIISDESLVCTTQETLFEK